MSLNGTIVPCWTVILLVMAEMNTPDAKRKCVIFDNVTREKHRDSMNLPPWVVEANKKMKAIDCSFIPYKDDEEEPCLIPKNDVIEMNISLVDVFVNPIVFLQESKGYEGSNLVQAKVIRHFCDEDGNITCNANIQPELNTMMYGVEFPNGEILPYAANVMADNIQAQVDPDKQRYVIFDSIIDYHVDNGVAIAKENMYRFVNGQRTMQRSTAEVKFLCLLKKGSEQWFSLKYLKEFNPVLSAEYA